MKKVYILINHFQVQDGVARTAVGLANELSKRDDIEVTLQSIFKYDSEMNGFVSPRVKTKAFLGFYFRGLAKIVDRIPARLLYKMLVRETFDVEIGFCMELPIKIIAASTNNTCAHYAWMHGYDNGLKLFSCYQKMDKVITVSKCNKERFWKESNGTIMTVCCHNLMDDKRITSMGSENIVLPKKNGVTFVAVGRLEQGKGILRLIECCGRLKENGAVFSMWLIGDGEQRPALEQKVDELELRDYVIFLGAQKNPYAFISRADVLVCASYSEGYSTVCVESILLEVPVLTTDVDGAAEIIEEAKAGMKVGMEDECLYQGMKSILENPQLIAQWKHTLKDTKIAFSQSNRAAELRQLDF